MFARIREWWRKVLIWIFRDDEPIEEEQKEPLIEEVIRKLLDGDEDREVDGK